MRLLVLRSILVAVERNDPAAGAVRAAAGLANAAGAKLHFVSVVPKGKGGVDTALHAILAKALEGSGVRVEDASIHTLEGDPASVIGLHADRVSADVMVLGPHRMKGSSAPGIGGTALAVVTNASCPCLVISSELRLPLRHVLVPVDLSDTARGALLVGLSWASALRVRNEGGASGAVRLTALHVAPGSVPATAASTPRAIENELELVRTAGGSWAGVSIEGETIGDDSAMRGITTYVRDHAPDLVVMGTRGLGLDGVGRLGSVSASVSGATATPTLLVPPAVWLTHRDSATDGSAFEGSRA